MPRPRSLTTADLAAAALAVLDREGLAALTMRAVAKELGMATMALYRYVRDRDELEVLVADQVFAAIDTTLPDGSDWRERVTVLLENIRNGFSAHPAAVPIVLRRRQSAVESLRVMETMLAVLTEGGFTGRARVIAQRTLIAFLIGYLQNKHYAPLPGEGTVVLAELPPEEYPHLAQTAGQAKGMSADDEFRGGVEIVLRGLRP
ncbi:TetR/AcrR family transcriptional regulator C-terminal domain-containing protein [Nocardia beijingensis]|uniref:TetR/AcrR family transcriptional regulator C-terminal domain-containing protein n=1 Tax=Nocardia beijingensis TaxID=95162 RepID=UPI001893E65A|nr:TetR/AcrR family transcriptional regulator C-terminal domain-containing protein [Nocardia beijingensis]MBF6075901.1 TetR/AcrR family transcriptional regulator C-terminal domain-containing protein [Nocardia beijingensis]